MAKKEDRKKQKKRLREQKRAARHDQLASERAKASLYPRILLQCKGGDPGFVAAVRELAAAFDFEDPSCCTEGQRGIFEMFRAVGMREMLRRAALSAKKAPQEGFSAEDMEDALLRPLTLHLGNWIFARLPDRYRDSPLPFHYFTVTPYGHHLYVSFAFLPTVSSEHGSIYCPPVEPKAAFGGGLWKVGFFRHAIERICERLCPTERIGYAHFNVCEIYFRSCLYYEPLELPDGQHAIRLFHDCATAAQSMQDPYVTDVLGMDRPPSKSTRLYYVLGYCPIAFVGPRAVAKTFLFPGFRNTPEDALVRATAMPPKERRRLLALASDNTTRKVLREEGLEAIKWYHDHGLPQVFELPHRVFTFEPTASSAAKTG